MELHNVIDHYLVDSWVIIGLPYDEVTCRIKDFLEKDNILAISSALILTDSFESPVRTFIPWIYQLKFNELIYINSDIVNFISKITKTKMIAKFDSIETKINLEDESDEVVIDEESDTNVVQYNFKGQ
jgi:hypothetical protein